MPKRTPVIVTDYRPKILAGSTTASGGAQTLIVHDINTSHSGNLLWSRLDKAGSSLADIVTRPHGALTDIDSNTHVDHTAVEIASGNGLTGGGFITESRTLAVGAGDGITVNANDVALTTPGTLSATTSNTASGNHTHAVSTGAASTLNATTANATGTSTNLARADHLHTITTGAASTLNATTANATGTSSNLARADHLHAITTGAASTLSATTANATGTSSSLARADHLHTISTGAASTLTVSTSNATGTSSNLARADHLHTITTSSNPGATASILASASDGGLGLLRLTSNSAFTSGFAGGGYRIDEGVSETGKTSAEFDNLTVRGRMRIYELLIQQIRATNGSMFVSSSSRAEVVSEDNDWYVNGEQLEVNGVGASFDIRLFTIRTRTTTGSGDRNLYHGFLVNDILRAQRVDISTGGGLITRQVNLLVTKFVDLWEYDALLVSSDAPVVGDEMVRLGSTTDTTRQGSIYLTSDDSNAPFIDIVDEVASHAEWNQAGKIKARLGKLSGIVDNDFGEPISGYGLYSDNVYLKGQIVVGDASNKLWLNDANDGGLAIGGATKASAPFRVTATGALTSTSGAIGGWTIGSTTLTAGTGSNAVGISSGAASNAFWAGNTNNAAAPFRVSRDGYLYAESGLVGGWILGLTSLTNLSSGASRVGLVADATGAGVAIYAGDDVPANADFRVTANGALTATSATITGSVTSTSGAIGGWTIDSTTLKNSATSGASRVGLVSNATGTGVAIYAGSDTVASAPFRVTAAGALTSTSGAIGGWAIGSATISSSTLTIDSSGPSIRSGKSSYSDTTPGFWIGLDSSDSNKPKFHFGGTVSGVERYIRWSGTALEINQPTISQPSLSATWQGVSYNQDWGTFATGHALKYMRMGDFVFIHGWVENDTYHSYTSGDYPTITKSLPAPDGKQLIFARVGARDGNGVPIDITPTMEGYGEVLEISEAGWLTLLTYNVDTPPVILEKQDLIINGWYKAAA